MDVAFNPLKAKDITPLKMDVVGKDYIPLIKGAYNVLTGRGGAGKSQIALKSLLLYLRANPNENGLAFLTEDGINETKDRIKAICKNSFLDYDEYINRIFFISLENDDRVKWCHRENGDIVTRNEYIQSVALFCVDNNIGYVILDPLKRFHSINESDNNEMDILVRDGFTKFASLTNTVLLVLHHSSKSTDHGGESRGASTITDSARISWTIAKAMIKDKRTGKLIADEDYRGKVKLSVIKDNWGIERYCKIRRDEDMVDLPVSDNGLSVEVTTFQDDNDFLGGVA
jgi:RecA-family ATPase